MDERLVFIITCEYLFVSGERGFSGECMCFLFAGYNDLCCVGTGEELRYKDNSFVLTYRLPRCERYVTLRYGTGVVGWIKKVGAVRESMGILCGTCTGIATMRLCLVRYM